METTQRTDGLLTRSVRVLETLAGMEQPVTLPVLAQRLGLPTTQTYRVLRALEAEGFVDHVGRRGYRCGVRALSLGALLGLPAEIRDVARPVLTRLAAATGVSVRFHLRSGHDRVLLLAAVAPGRREPGAEPLLGERSSLTRGCSGHAILAHLPASGIDEVVRGRPGRVTRSELARVRRDGFAVSHGDNHEGRSGIAVPVATPDEPEPLGALSLSGPDGIALRDLAGPLTSAAADLAGALATQVGPHGVVRRRALDVGVLRDEPPGVSSRSSRCPGR